MSHTCQLLACLSSVGGRIEGDVRINGHPKEQDSFARVSGYVEQFDTHSAASTVHEALMYSGTLRNEKEIDKDTTEAFVDQVWDLSIPCTPCCRVCCSLRHPFSCLINADQHAEHVSHQLLLAKQCFSFVTDLAQWVVRAI